MAAFFDRTCGVLGLHIENGKNCTKMQCHVYSEDVLLQLNCKVNKGSLADELMEYFKKIDLEIIINISSITIILDLLKTSYFEGMAFFAKGGTNPLPRYENKLCILSQLLHESAIQIYQ